MISHYSTGLSVERPGGTTEFKLRIGLRCARYTGKDGETRDSIRDPLGSHEDINGVPETLGRSLRVCLLGAKVSTAAIRSR